MIKAFTSPVPSKLILCFCDDTIIDPFAVMLPKDTQRDFILVDIYYNDSKRIKDTTQRNKYFYKNITFMTDGGNFTQHPTVGQKILTDVLTVCYCLINLL